MTPITLIIGPQKPVFYSENLPGLPGSCDDSDEFVDGPDRLLGVSALGGRRPFLGGEIMESRREEAIRLAGVRVFGPSGAVQPPWHCGAGHPFVRCIARKAGQFETGRCEPVGRFTVIVNLIWR